MYKATFSIADVEITAEFKVYGSYRPATNEEPAEYPEVEVQSLTDEMGNDLEPDGEFFVQAPWQFGNMVDVPVATEAEAWDKAEDIADDFLKQIEEF